MASSAYPQPRRTLEPLASRLMLDDVRDIATASAFEKGQRYWRQARVVHLSVENGGTRIRARVRGSELRPYSQTIELEEVGPGDLAIAGECSCPVGQDCKHVVAALVATIARNSLRQEAPKLHGAQETLPPNLAAWIDTLAQLDRNESEVYPPEVRQRLVYVLGLARQPSQAAYLVVQPQAVHLRKDDSLSDRARPYNPSSIFQANIAKFVRPSDRAILKSLNQMRYAHGAVRGLPLSGEEGASVLKAILATGRARWAEIGGPVVTQGPPRRGSATWRLAEDGSHRLDFDVASDGEGVLAAVCLAPPWYIDVRTGVVGPIETDFAPRVAEALLSAPPAQPRQLRLLRSAFTERLPHLASIEPPEIAPERITSRPVPVLRLTTFELMANEYYFGSRGLVAQKERVLTARPAFRYGDFELAAADARAEPTFARGGRVFEIKRDAKTERGALAQLQDLGFRKLSALHAFGLPQEIRGDLALESSEGWLDFLDRQAPALRGDGWVVELDPDFPLQVVRADGDVFADVREGSGMDWFELDLGVVIDGERVDLTQAILAAIAAPGFSAKSTAEPANPDAAFYLRLADGRMLALPAARLQPILAALYELLASGAGEANAKRLGLSALDAAGLAEFEAAAPGIVWRGGEKLRELGRMLRETGGIPRAQVPASFAAELRPYQARGVDWLQFLRAAGLGGVLADDMGLGKTVQTLAHIAIEKAEGRLDRPVLVVSPTSLVANWRREAERFAPELKVLALHGPDRKTQFDAIPAHDIVITTYPLLVRDRAVLETRPWHIVLLDEAQTIKNPDAATTQLATQIEARSRLCLTGTPLENHLGEIWSLFRFLSPGFLGDRQTFNRQWRNPIEKQGDRERQLLLARRVRPFLLRRTKGEVAADLPPKTEIVEAIEMERAQRDLYESIRLAMHAKVRDAIAAKGLARSRIVVLDALLKLRQVCCDPRLLKLKKASAKARSAKLSRLMEMLVELRQEGRRILLFSQFTSMLALIEEELARIVLPYALLTGQTRDRATPIRRFQDGEVPLFLISLKAGGVGLNLTAADTVIHYDPWWNPAVEDQASDRAHRIGQTKPVFVHKLMTLGSIEEKMESLKAKKRALAAGLFDPEAGGALDLTEAEVEALLGA